MDIHLSGKAWVSGSAILLAGRGLADCVAKKIDTYQWVLACSTPNGEDYSPWLAYFHDMPVLFSCSSISPVVFEFETTVVICNPSSSESMLPPERLALSSPPSTSLGRPSTIAVVYPISGVWNPEVGVSGAGELLDNAMLLTERRRDGSRGIRACNAEGSMEKSIEAGMVL